MLSKINPWAPVVSLAIAIGAIIGTYAITTDTTKTNKEEIACMKKDISNIAVVLENLKVTTDNLKESTKDLKEEVKELRKGK
jgi:hypothetical protein